MAAGNIDWPDGKRFAFSVFDDTDRATLENNRAVYGLLADLGFRTTKSVWAFDGDAPPYIPGVTCDEPRYLAWLHELQAKGFEIGWHLATWESSERSRTEQGLDRFRELFGDYPRSMANHASNEEGIYWGGQRFSSWRKAAFSCIPGKNRFYGHDPEDRRFWGDLCLERIRYVRNFVFDEIDTLACCPAMPYHDSSKPYVSRWFASSSGGDVDEYNQLLRPENQQRLEESGGACIVYTHFGKRFAEGSKLNETFEKRMTELAARGGWFVPVSTLLDFLESRRDGSSAEITGRQRAALEYRWIRERLTRRWRNRKGAPK